MMRKSLWMALLLALLTGVAQAGVVENPEDVPRDFGDEPPTGIYAKKRKNRPGAGASIKVTPPASATSTSGSLRSTAQARQRSENGGKKTSTKKPSDKDGKSAAQASGAYPNVPGNKETWPMLAIAVLLMLAAGGGGYYLYSNSDEE